METLALKNDVCFNEACAATQTLIVDQLQKIVMLPFAKRVQGLIFVM